MHTCRVCAHCTGSLSAWLTYNNFYCCAMHICLHKWSHKIDAASHIFHDPSENHNKSRKTVKMREFQWAREKDGKYEVDFNGQKYWKMEWFLSERERNVKQAKKQQQQLTKSTQRKLLKKGKIEGKKCSHADVYGLLSTAYHWVSCANKHDTVCLHYFMFSCKWVYVCDFSVVVAQAYLRPILHITHRQRRFYLSTLSVPYFYFSCCCVFSLRRSFFFNFRQHALLNRNVLFLLVNTLCAVQIISCANGECRLR